MRGFTLMELIIVVAILAILAVAGFPSMRDLIVSARVRGAASDLNASLLIARSEAVKRNASVDVVPSVVSNWGAGWRVEIAATSDDVNVQQPIPADVTVAGPNASIRYRGDGRLIDPATGALLAAEVAFTFASSEYSHIQMRCIDIAPSGRPSIRIDRDRDSSNGCN